MYAFRAVGLVAGIAAATSSAEGAIFTGWTTSMSTNGAGQEVWSLNANFDVSGLVLSQLLNYESLSGSLAAVHTNTAAGLWNPVATGAADAMADSYVTATGNYGSTTGLMFEDTSPTSLPWHAGWYPLATPIMGQSWKVAQIVRESGSGTHTAALRIGFKVAGTTTVLFGDGQWTIGVPAPGAFAALVLSSLVQRRRR